MLFTEWNWDDALAVRYEEGREEGWIGGREEGREENLEENIRNLLSYGMSPDEVAAALKVPREKVTALM